MRFRVESLWGAISGLLLSGLVLLVCVAAAAETVSHEHHGCAALASEKMGLSKATSPTLWNLPAGPGVVVAQPTPSEPSPAEEFPDPVPADFRDTLAARSPPVRL
jgi:hypothetical protein